MACNAKQAIFFAILLKGRLLYILETPEDSLCEKMTLSVFLV